jgi:hypothetical protein
VREFRVGVELLMDTGRRLDEICQLPLQCLDPDTDGNDVLVYTDYKANRADRRRPIAASTAALIRDQEQRTRERLPDSSDQQLALLPAKQRNPHGSRAIRATTLPQAHRQWVDGLPAPRLPDGTVFPGNTSFRTPTDTATPSGTPTPALPWTFCATSWATGRPKPRRSTNRITEKRTREAVDQLATYQYDGTGQHLAREVTQLLDSERNRRGIGQVAVPFGVCAEPSNVEAGGPACPTACDASAAATSAPAPRTIPDSASTSTGSSLTPNASSPPPTSKTGPARRPRPATPRSPRAATWCVASSPTWPTSPQRSKPSTTRVTACGR